MQSEDTTFYQLPNHERGLDFSTPLVMGILNLTPDSFFDGGQYSDNASISQQVERMLQEGADIIDLGAQSSRPGAEIITKEEEEQRLLPALQEIRTQFPETVLSVDTFRSNIARKSVEHGANIINDIAAGTMDEKMLDTIIELDSPYILMHMQGQPKNMQDAPSYEHVTKEVIAYLQERVKAFQEKNFNKLILDPGFGFGKTVEHNYELLQNLNQLQSLGFPILVGLSRKSMIQKVLNVSAAEALNGTSILNTIALLNGANILRVHDVKEAKECILLAQQLKS